MKSQSSLAMAETTVQSLLIRLLNKDLLNIHEVKK